MLRNSRKCVLSLGLMMKGRPNGMSIQCEKKINGDVIYTLENGASYGRHISKYVINSRQQKIVSREECF